MHFLLNTCTMASACNEVGKMLVFFIVSLMSNTALGTSYPFECISEIRSDYFLPDLSFSYGDLEPFIDKATVKVHHLGHHAGYTRKLNLALQQWRSEEPESYVATSILDLLQHLDDIPPKYKQGIRNNGGGFVNHNLYWSTMAANKKNQTTMPSGELLDEIVTSFGSFEEFRRKFTLEALSLFGSGYVWLSQRIPSSLKKDKDTASLVISTTANQDSPISQGLQPILVLDVWEHAYYLKHQNRRANHVEDWWRVIDWSVVAKLSNWWTGKSAGGHDEL